MRNLPVTPADPCDRTEEMLAITLEQPRSTLPTPIRSPLEGAPAYLVEVHSSRRPAMLYAVRHSLGEARDVADSVHPTFGDVIIREVPLPCDADTLIRAMAEMRSWSREGSCWSPPLQ